MNTDHGYAPPSFFLPPSFLLPPSLFTEELFVIESGGIELFVQQHPPPHNATSATSASSSSATARRRRRRRNGSDELEDEMMGGGEGGSGSGGGGGGGDGRRDGTRRLFRYTHGVVGELNFFLGQPRTFSARCISRRQGEEEEMRVSCVHLPLPPFERGWQCQSAPKSALAAQRFSLGDE